MTITAKKIQTQISRLSRTDQAELATFLFDVLNNGEEETWEQAWTKEIKKREKAARAGKVKYIPAKQVLAGVRKKLAQ